MIPNIEAQLDGAHNLEPPLLVYYILPTRLVVLSYLVEIVNLISAKWCEAFVDAHTGELVGLTAFVTAASVSTEPNPHSICC